MTAEENSVNPREPKENEGDPLNCELTFLHLCNVLETIIHGAQHARRMAENLYAGCKVTTMNAEFDEYSKEILERLKMLEKHIEENSKK